MLGLEKGVVRLVAYNPEWKDFYQSEKTTLQTALGSYILDIQHVGSTSIPGMVAKPIIDIAVAVHDFEEAKACIPLVESVGYEYRGEFGLPRRHYFVRGEPRLFHLHMSEITSLEWQNTLLFRDYLIQHPEAAVQYAQLKRRLAEQFPHDREAYLDGKSAFVEGVIRSARSSG